MTIRRMLLGTVTAFVIATSLTPVAASADCLTRPQLGDCSAFNTVIMIFVAYEAECGTTLPDKARENIETFLAAMSENDIAIADKRVEAIKARLGYNKTLYCKLFEQTVIRFL